MKPLRIARNCFSALRLLSPDEMRPNSTVLGAGGAPQPKIGIALGGGFARGIAHTGVLNVLLQRGIPIHCITGVSAGAIVAAAFASGTSPDEIARAGCSMRFGDVASWSLCRMGFVTSERMKGFLERLLKTNRFEDMRTPLGVAATDLATGESVSFRDSGDVVLPIRASCSYPGLFKPVEWDGRMLVDGGMSVEIPALLARELGATHVISVYLPAPVGNTPPSNVFQVVNRCFQILQTRVEEGWRQDSDLVIAPDVSGVDWNGFQCAPQLIRAGEAATEAALPEIWSWLTESEDPVPDLSPAGAPTIIPPAIAPGSIPA